MTPLESLLADLDDLGWTISWAFQFAPNHWRVSIIHTACVGTDPGTYISHCADAPTFAEALEDAITRRNEAEFTADTPVGFSLAPPEASLVERLGILRPSAPFPRRI